MPEVSAGRIGRYEILKVLGRGGMGEVLLAQDENLGRRVAIKRPFKSALEEGLARFQVEARAATLRHPNIPAVYEMGEQDGLPYIAMEFVEGRTLKEIIETGQPVDLMTKLNIIEQVCSALGYAHQNGVIHRDIKPANIIVQADGVAKIIDFGIAKVQDMEGKTGLTQTSQVIGSLHYIAPERFKGGHFDGRADIFSAGVTLFKFLTGEEPFTGGEATASYKIVNEAHTPLSHYLQDYPSALDEIIAKSLAKNPEDRYTTAEDFADALHEVTEDLKHSRVTTLFNDAERLATEHRFAPALELLDEAVRLDPSNTQVRKLRKFVREHQERARREERMRECLLRADEALAASQFEDALAQLKEAQSIDNTSTDVQARIREAQDRKRRYEIGVRALTEADAARARGDVTGAQRIVARALGEDPENKRLAAAGEILAREAEQAARKARIAELVAGARSEVAARNFSAAEKLIGEAEAIDPANVDADALRREVLRLREQDQRRAILTEIEARIHEFIRTDAYDQANELLGRALEKLPNDSTLLRLRMELEAAARKFGAKLFVDTTIAQAREIFPTSPLEALNAVQSALEQMPGEEHLVAYELSLRKDLEALRSEQLRADTVAKAREFLRARQFEKAIGVLESFQIEFGNDAEIDELLALARSERDTAQRSALIERCTADGRNLIRNGSFDEAIALLERGVKETGDATLSSLLQEARDQQAAFARRIEALRKRVESLRSSGAYDEAFGLLQEQLALNPGLHALQDLAQAIGAEREVRDATARALEEARAATGRHDFAAALESLEAVQRAYGDSTQLTAGIEDVRKQRAAWALESVNNSIETARAALLRKDATAALDSLQASAPHLEFVEEKTQADWQRIADSTRQALERAGAATGTLDRTLSLVRPQRKLPIALIVSVAAILLAAIGVLLWKVLSPAPTAAAPTEIAFASAPPGASITIDGGSPGTADASGSLQVNVAPGTHEVQVNASGFEPWKDTIQVVKGEITRERVNPQPLPPAGAKTGKLSFLLQGGLTHVRVIIDGKNYGTRTADDTISLPTGTYSVKYQENGYDDSPAHPVQIAENGNTQDPVNLEKAAPVQAPPAPTQQQARAPARAQQQAQPLVQPVTPTPTPAPAPSPTGSLNVSTNSIEQGQSVTLSWQTSNASSVEISGLGQVAPSGTASVHPDAPITYVLKANGNLLAQQSVDVRPKPQAQPTPAPAVAVEPAGPVLPDASALKAALGQYEALFAQAAGKGGKECKADFKGQFGGRLSALANWCDDAKSFRVAENCRPDVHGTPEAPSLTCDEVITMNPKDGASQSFPPAQKHFQFSKNSDGSWKLTGW
jgi:eukaryotic-like serine/threonine-protein kinase